MLFRGNCLDLLKSLEDNSIDSVVTDPPYELTSKSGKGGFMGKEWDSTGIAFSVELWQECLRVLKPGGHLLAFGGSRTYHRIAVAIEDAGFEIRDSIHWTYGSGFPKSHNISKAIDKAKGAERTEVVGFAKGVVVEDDQGYGGIARGGVEIVQKSADIPITAPATPEAEKWNGWGTALKPSHEPIIVARKPLSGTIAQNVLEYGVGGLNIDGTRIGTSGENFDDLKGRPITKLATRRNDETDEEYKARLLTNPSQQEALEKLKTMGRWTANTMITHSSGCRQAGVAEDSVVADERTANFGTQETQSGGNGSGNWGGRSMSVSVWECVEGCPVLDFPDTASTGNGSKSGHRKGGASETAVGLAGQKNAVDGYADGGSASRFFTQTTYEDIDFPPFIYQAKAGKKERDAGLDSMPETQWVQWQTGNGESGKPLSMSEGRDTKRRNTHPTVKPLALMRTLVRLVTPKGGKVLDPFLGSGTTALAAIYEGCEWVGSELTEDYYPIIEARVAWAIEQVNAPEKKPKSKSVSSDETPTLF